jgi:hypothetical protein
MIERLDAILATIERLDRRRQEFHRELATGLDRIQETETVNRDKIATFTHQAEASSMRRTP